MSTPNILSDNDGNLGALTMGATTTTSLGMVGNWDGVHWTLQAPRLMAPISFVP